jgi:hypothetical protein
MDTSLTLRRSRTVRIAAVAGAVAFLATAPACARKAPPSAKATSAEASSPARSDTLGYDYGLVLGKDSGELRIDLARGKDSAVAATGSLRIGAETHRLSGSFDRKHVRLKADVFKIFQYGEEPKGTLALALSDDLDSLSGRWDSSEATGVPLAGRLAMRIVRKSVPHRDSSAFIEYPLLVRPELRKFNPSISASLPRDLEELDSARFSIDFVSPEMLLLFEVRDDFREHGEKVGTIVPKYPETAYEQRIFDARLPARLRSWRPYDLVKADSVCRQLVDSVIAVKRSDRHYFVRAAADHLEFGIRGRMEPFAESLYSVPVAVDCRPQALLPRQP